MKNKIVKTKLTESEMKLYLSGDQTCKAGGTLKGNQINSVRGGELSFRNHGLCNLTALASSFLSPILCVRLAASICFYKVVSLSRFFQGLESSDYR